MTILMWISVFAGGLLLVAALASKIGILPLPAQVWLCDALDWHEASPESLDGASLHGLCRFCGRHVMMDSHGDWFSCERKEKR